MNDFLPALIAGVVFSMGGMLFFAFLMLIGELIEWMEKS
tara:strand:+ start:327 stop:443 length:117 start_codon:yes stop_codon:yes gene_type:complete